MPARRPDDWRPAGVKTFVVSYRSYSLEAGSATIERRAERLVIEVRLSPMDEDQDDGIGAGPIRRPSRELPFPPDRPTGRGALKARSSRGAQAPGLGPMAGLRLLAAVDGGRHSPGASRAKRGCWASSWGDRASRQASRGTARVVRDGVRGDRDRGSPVAVVDPWCGCGRTTRGGGSRSPAPVVGAQAGLRRGP